MRRWVVQKKRKQCSRLFPRDHVRHRDNNMIHTLAQTPYLMVGDTFSNVHSRCLPFLDEAKNLERNSAFTSPWDRCRFQKMSSYNPYETCVLMHPLTHILHGYTFLNRLCVVLPSLWVTSTVPGRHSLISILVSCSTVGWLDAFTPQHLLVIYW